MRTVRCAMSAAVATALIIGVAGCAGLSPQKGQRAAVTSSPVVSAKATTLTSPSATTTTAPGAGDPLSIDWAAQAPFTGNAADRYGADRVMAAYKEAVMFSLVQGYSPLMARGYEAKADEFSFVKPYLTPGANTYWAGYVKGALAKNEAAGTSLRSLTLWNVADGQSKYKFRPGQRVFVAGASFTAGTPSLEVEAGVTLLVMKFTVTRNIRLMDGAKAVLVPFKKDITYWMKPAGTKAIPFQIDRWEAGGTSAAAVPDPSGADL